MCPDLVPTCRCIGMLRRLAFPTLPSLFIRLSVRLAVQFSRRCVASCAVFLRSRVLASPLAPSPDHFSGGARTAVGGRLGGGSPPVQPAAMRSRRRSSADRRMLPCLGRFFASEPPTRSGSPHVERFLPLAQDILSLQEETRTCRCHRAVSCQTPFPIFLFGLLRD
jgi:hypothetical protein